MSFFDNLKDKVSKGGAAVGSGAKYAVEMAKLNAQISGKKKVINDTFNKIGEKYFESVADNAPEEFKELVETVIESRKEIERLNDEIKKLKGVAVCPFCNSEIESESRFCSVCGKELPVADSEGDFVD
ncbi:MAG: hypothetical protein IKR68_05620 [Lachnospiraceae bacterium]|nr:hypothetical protein [Lachnospiraceae bacterium]